MKLWLPADRLDPLFKYIRAQLKARGHTQGLGKLNNAIAQTLDGRNWSALKARAKGQVGITLCAPDSPDNSPTELQEAIAFAIEAACNEDVADIVTHPVHYARLRLQCVGVGYDDSMFGGWFGTDDLKGHLCQKLKDLGLGSWYLDGARFCTNASSLGGLDQSLEGLMAEVAQTREPAVVRHELNWVVGDHCDTVGLGSDMLFPLETPHQLEPIEGVWAMPGTGPDAEATYYFVVESVEVCSEDGQRDADGGYLTPFGTVELADIVAKLREYDSVVFTALGRPADGQAAWPMCPALSIEDGAIVLELPMMQQFFAGTDYEDLLKVRGTIEHLIGLSRHVASEMAMDFCLAWPYVDGKGVRWDHSCWVEMSEFSLDDSISFRRGLDPYEWLFEESLPEGAEAKRVIYGELELDGALLGLTAVVEGSLGERLFEFQVYPMNQSVTTEQLKQVLPLPWVRTGHTDYPGFNMVRTYDGLPLYPLPPDVMRPAAIWIAPVRWEELPATLWDEELPFAPPKDWAQRLFEGMGVDDNLLLMPMFPAPAEWFVDSFDASDLQQRIQRWCPDKTMLTQEALIGIARHYRMEYLQGGLDAIPSFAVVSTSGDLLFRDNHRQHCQVWNPLVEAYVAGASGEEVATPSPEDAMGRWLPDLRKGGASKGEIAAWFGLPEFKQLSARVQTAD
ncbi:hypothetical protein [Ferrimonas marina]|uniref:Uncharacterized protein n=1 Tax=Ferrimonas marina TaxID=299255 RepID=A0A1M5U6T3_9GAMM|nr:hypothetical protein [Ferrimonas marina]SHH58638.1 hypothetical protein SAMN02745129_2430 [Ferrimonas marina]